VRHFTCKSYHLILILLLSYPLSAQAMPAITCHCFTDRSYDPARPTLADPYFLAMTQNTFFAELFAVEKKTIVLKKQKGTSADDLWVAYWIATKSGAPADVLLRARQSKDNWQEIVAAMGISTRPLGARFSGALQANSAVSRLAETVVNGLLTEYKLLTDGDVATMRKAGASNQELILAALIANKTKRQVIQLYREVKSGVKSWGALLLEAKLEPTDMHREVLAQLKVRP
jgi:hypothetical protein